MGREKTAQKDEARILLADSKGRVRLRIAVDSTDLPAVEILDEGGKVMYRLPQD